MFPATELFAVAVAGILGALLGAMAALLLVAALPHLRRTGCRCCGAELDQPGGCAIGGFGFGFCESCARRILRRR